MPSMKCLNEAVAYTCKTLLAFLSKETHRILNSYNTADVKLNELRELCMYAAVIMSILWSYGARHAASFVQRRIWSILQIERPISILRYNSPQYIMIVVYSSEMLSFGNGTFESGRQSLDCDRRPTDRKSVV